MMETQEDERAFERACVDLREIATAGIQEIRADARRRGVRIVPHTGTTPVWVMGDPLTLAEVLGNLLGNALAVTGPGDAITVQVSGGNGRARLVVSDTGAGISAWSLQRVFDDVPREAGRGLSVVRRLVEQQDGNVEVHSDGRGLGARFVVTLRSATPDAA